MVLIGRMSPISLGTQFHSKIWQKVESKDYQLLPQRHQPHNNRRPDDEVVEQSIHSLILLCDAFWTVDISDRSKEFYHSKAMAILVKGHKQGGCYAAGYLTSQGLLHCLAILGLIPVGLARWGEIASNPSYLEDRGILIKNGKADMFLQTLSFYLKITPCEAEQIICKFGRKSTLSEKRYEDAIYPGQKVYSLEDDEFVRVFDGMTETKIPLPATIWPDTRASRRVDDKFWFRRTSKKVRGGSRVNNRKRQRRDDPTENEIEGYLPTNLELFETVDEIKLTLSLNSLLGAAIGGNPLKWDNIFATWRKKGTNSPLNYHFSFRDHNNVLVTPDPPSCSFQCEIDCKIDGILRYAATINRPVLSRAVFRLIESPAGRAQYQSRVPDDDHYTIAISKKDIHRGYYALYHKEESKKARSKGRQRKIAVVTFLRRDTLLLAICNNNYSLEQPDGFLLHRNN